MPDINRTTAQVLPVLLRKVRAVLADVNGQLPPRWELAIFETVRTAARARGLLAAGRSRTTRSRHVLEFCRSGMCEAVDVAFKHDGQWTWNVPATFWDLVDSAKRAHALRSMRFPTFVDDPHCELANQ